MRRRLLVSLGFCVAAGTAHAEPGRALTVERSAAASDCPDADALTARVEGMLGRQLDPSASYSVAFNRDGRGFRATIRAGENGSTVRELEARESSCGPLARAAVVTLVLLFDPDFVAGKSEPDAELNPAPPPPAPPKPPPPAVLPPLPPPSLESSGTRARFGLSVGGAALAAVLRPFAPAALADAGLELQRVRMSIGALWVPTQRLSLGPGNATETVIAGSLRTCFALQRSEAFRVDACSGALLGAASARAHGFSRDSSSTKPWFALPIELAASTRRRSLGLELSVGALLSPSPLDFAVTGLGTTYHSPSIAGQLALRAFWISGDGS